MGKFTSFGAALLVACCCSGVASAENRTFIIANNSDGYGIDRCLANGESCGASVAAAYCQSPVVRAREHVPEDREGRDHRRGADLGPQCLRRQLRQLRGDHLLKVASVMAGHSPSKTGVNALMPGHLDKERSAFLSGMPGTRPGMTKITAPESPRISARPRQRCPRA